VAFVDDTVIVGLAVTKTVIVVADVHPPGAVPVTV
jgi:hypothetical protein